MNELTSQDIDNLIDAVDAWEERTRTRNSMGSLMTAVLCRTPEERLKVEAEMAGEKAREKNEAKAQREQAIRLRAKLLSVRDSLDAERLLDEATR